MLKIERIGNGEIVFILSGRLEADNVSELSALLAAEGSGPRLALDLSDVVLVDRAIVQFLAQREVAGVTLRNCPLYIREWITREQS